MSAAALAAHPAAPHPQPHTAAAGARPRGGGTTIKVPLRIVTGAQYGDTALSVYVKVAALALRPEGCTARVDTLARYLGTSKSTVERGLRPLRRPDPVDGITELPTRQRTKRGGTGDSAHRVTRVLDPGELWVRIPVRTAEALTPRLLRLYALLAFATARNIPVTAAELGEMLRHQTGKHAGESLGERQVRRLIDELEESGWLTVHRREGEQGRHAYEVHRHPLRAVPATAAAGSADQAPEQGAGAPVIHDGPGSDDHDGPLATEEDRSTDRPDETKLGGGSRRRRGTGSKPATPASDLAGGTFGPGVSRAPRGTRPVSSTGRAPYGGPELRWTERIHISLAPVRHLLQQPDANRFLLRRVAREIGRQLDTAATTLITPERMAARIATRYRDAGPIRDIAAWLLVVGIVPRGCGQPLCEGGQLWPTGAICETCATNRQTTTAHWRRARAWQDRLEDVRAQHTGGEGEQLPAKASYRQRDRATDAEVLAVAAAHGPEAALHRYGVLRAGPVLRAHHGHLPAAVGGLPPQPHQPTPPVRPLEEAPMPGGYMPDHIRTQLGRTEDTGALTVRCPQPGCLADEGQACTSKGGRRRAPHEARTTAALSRGEEPRS